jgi:hypothetical protein
LSQSARTDAETVATTAHASASSARPERTNAKICGQLLATPMAITYSAEQDEESFALTRHRRGPDWHCISTPQPRTVVVVFL